MGPRQAFVLPLDGGPVANDTAGHRERGTLGTGNVIKVKKLNVKLLEFSF